MLLKHPPISAGFTGQKIYDDSEIWYLNGRYHRIDGPAFVDDSGFVAWWAHGRRHRMDGPALVSGNGRVEYYINGEEIRSVRRFQILTGMTEGELLAMILRYGKGSMEEDYEKSRFIK